MNGIIEVYDSEKGEGFIRRDNGLSYSFFKDYWTEETPPTLHRRVRFESNQYNIIALNITHDETPNTPPQTQLKHFLTFFMR